MTVVAPIRTPSHFSVPWRTAGSVADATTGRWQDKRPHVVGRWSGCFCFFFVRVSHVAGQLCDVPITLNIMVSLGFWHVSESCNVR